MRYLTKAVETYRVGTEAEAAEMIEEAKQDKRFALIKYEAVHKEKKAKGEVIDEWIRVTLHKAFNEEACPDSEIEIDYKKTLGFFPGVEAIKMNTEIEEEEKENNIIEF